ncbi:MAG: MliC family protein, partial [Candidatus Pacebacteria bacterium]|nr:MliC family protein [Candidatus Paceibacterota bacterium]
MKKIYIAIIILLIGVVAWIFIISQSKTLNNEEVQLTFVSQADYLCNEGKTINAKYYKGPEAPVPQPGEPPTPTGSVELVLSDGRQLTLAQTISGSGIRYATSNEAIIFWSKGNSAFITENDVQTYQGCIAIAKDPGNLPQVYASSTAGFSIRYPAGYTIDTSYQYQELGLGKEINGVKFIIPEEMATGTNLSSFNTGVSIETISGAMDCNAGLFLDMANNSTSTIITDNNVQYSMASSTGAGAGNFYEETVWAIPGTNPCMAIRYFVHSTNIGNYPEGAVQE